MSSRDRSLVGVILVVLVAVVGYFLLVAPKHSEAGRLQAQVVSTQGKLSQVEAQVQAGVAAESQYRNYAGQLTDLQRAVPADEQIPGLINQLQGASSRNHVQFESVSTSGGTGATATSTAAASTAGSFPSQSFNLTFTGDYFSVAGLLGTLHRFVRADNTRFSVTGRLISIGSVSLSPQGSSGSAGGSGSVSASVTAVDYDIPDALTAGSSASAPSTSTAPTSP